MKDKEQIMDKVMLFAEKVKTNNYLSAISNGLMMLMPLLMIGSIALLLAVLPIDAWKQFLTDAGISTYLMAASTLTTSLIALYASFTVAYCLAENLGQKAIGAGCISAFCFLVITPLANFETGSYLDISWLGAKGLFGAMIVALIAGRLYCFFLEKKIIIKMPDSVPPVVSTTFAALFPAIIVGFLFIFVAFGFSLTKYGSFTDFVYAIISAPLQNLSGSVWSLLFIVLVQMVFWFFGLHGSLVVGSFVSSLYLPMDTMNMEAVMAGVANSDLPNIMGKSFYALFAGIGGAGGTLSLIIVMLIFAKAKQHKAFAKLAVAPGCFSINEPIVFGLPLILNPIMAIPFVLVPLVQVFLAYLAIASNIVPRLSGVQVPFAIPILFNGFIAGGWRVAALQVVLIAIGILIYFPFFKVLDKQALKSGEVSSEETLAQ